MRFSWKKQSDKTQSTKAGGLPFPRVLPNPPPPERPTVRTDAWQNTYLGLGDTRDKMSYTEFAITETDRLLTHDTLEMIYYNDTLAARACDALPEEALRRGFQITSVDKQENADELCKYHDKLKTAQTILTCMCWANVFGTAAIIIGANDGADVAGLAEPLNENSIKSVDYLNIIYGRYMVPGEYYTDPAQPKYGQLKSWKIQSPFGGQLLEVHESRIVIFDATRVTPIRRMQRAGQADSLLQRAYKVIATYNMAVSAVGNLMTDNGVGVFKLKGLIEMIARNPETLQTRMALVDVQKSVSRSLMLDTEEDYQRQFGSFSGMGDILEFLMLWVSLALRMPMAVLFGREPAGMNATGDSDFRMWYDRVRSVQENTILPVIRTINKYCGLAKDSGLSAYNDDDFDVVFPELHQATETEVADIAAKRAIVAKTYVDMGSLTPEEVTNSAFGPGGYEQMFSVDIEEHAQLMDEERARTEEIERVKNENMMKELENGTSVQPDKA